MDKLTETYCHVDDFYKAYSAHIIDEEKQMYEKRICSHILSKSEIMTIIIAFHQDGYRDFKTYYTKHVSVYMREAFPKLVSYNRFVELMPSVMVAICYFIHSRLGMQTGIYFVDATTIEVCHVKRASSNRVFEGIAKKSKSSMGWYYGFKLHLVINDRGEIMAFSPTMATTDERSVVDKMTTLLQGKLYGDKGYISAELCEKLLKRGLQLFTRIKANMQNKLIPVFDKIMLRKRAVIESVNDQLKNISQIEHTRHRSPVNFMVNLLAGIAAYTLKDKKPSLNLTFNTAIAL